MTIYSREKLVLKGILYIVLLIIPFNCHAISVEKYRLLTTTSEGTNVIILDVLPNGQFVDPSLHYPSLVGQPFITINPDRTFAIVSWANVARYALNKKGSITYLGITTTVNGAGESSFTPDGKLLLVSTYSGCVYLVSTTGALIDTGNHYNSTYWTAIHPAGKIAICAIPPVPQGVVI